MTPHYRLELAPSGLLAHALRAGRRQCASLRPLAALRHDRRARRDARRSARAGESRRRGHVRRRAALDALGARRASTLVCSDDAIEIRTCGGGPRRAHRRAPARRALARRPARRTGFLPSGSRFRTLFSPNPGEPARPLRPAGEPAVIGVAGDSEPGRRHWFFTPAPLYLALTTAEGIVDPAEPWTTAGSALSAAAPVRELGFVAARLRAGATAASRSGSSTRATRSVDGEFEAPALVLTPGAPDPYTGSAGTATTSSARGAAPARRRRARRPRWWSEPIFCGWGAQCRARRPSNGGAGRRLRDAGELRRLPRAPRAARASCPARS